MSAPSVTSVTYDDSSGTLTIKGQHLPSQYSLNANDFTLIGNGGRADAFVLGAHLNRASDRLDQNSSVNSAGTVFTLKFTGTAAPYFTDLTQLLDKNGAQAQDGTNYQLELAAGWISGATTTQNLPITVVNAPDPVITGVNYDAADGVLIVNSSGIMNSNGSADPSLLSLSNFSLDGITLDNASGGDFNQLLNPSNLGYAGIFSITLSSDEQSAVNAALASNNDLIFNVSSGWYLGSGSAYSLNATEVNNIVPENQALSWGPKQQLDQPVQLAVSGSTLYIADALNKSVDAVPTAGGEASAAVTSGIGSPFGVAADAAGNLYLADYVGGRILEYMQGTGQLVTLQSKGLSGPSALAVDGAGNIYVADSWHGRIEKIAAGSHHISTLVSGLKFPNGIAVDAQGDVFYSNTNAGKVMELVAGHRSPIKLASGLENPRGLAVDSQGNVYVANTAANDVVEIAANTHHSFVLPALNVQLGSTMSAYNINLSEPAGIAVDANGNLYVSEDLSSLTAAGSTYNDIKELTHQFYVFNAAPGGSVAPQLIDNLWENTQQIQLTKTDFTALAALTEVGAANFSNSAKPTGISDYLFYDAKNGGLYYDSRGSADVNLGSAVELAIVGSSVHPSQLSVGDFTLI